MTRSGRLEQVNPDGSDRRVLAQNVRASAAVGPGRDGRLLACAEPGGSRRPDRGLLLAAAGGRPVPDRPGHPLGPVA